MEPNEYPLDPGRIKEFQTKLQKWHKNIDRGLPWRETRDPYSILVSEIMLHQTFVKKVIPVYKKFIREYPTVRKLANAKIEDIKRIMRTLGLNYRAEVLKRISRDIMEKFGGEIPRTKEELMDLTGIGEYTSSAILSFAYDKDEAIVDTNVIRLIDRVFGFPVMKDRNSPPKKVIKLANKLVPKRKSRKYNLAILDFSSLICTHYNPKSEGCPLKDICCKYEEG